MCRPLLAVYVLLFQAVSLSARDTLRYSREECEAVFLKENLLLLAEKLNISRAEAQLQQAKLWPNPSLTFDQVNLWATPGQTGGNETVPPLWNGFGRNQQFALEIEQLIPTAGKHKKLIALEAAGIDKAGQSFREVLRNLKTTFRRQLTELQYTQLQQSILESQLKSVRQITAAYERQILEGNIPESRFVRFKALELEIAQDLANWKMRNNEVQNSLKTLMHLAPHTALIVKDEDFDQVTPESSLLSLEEAFRTAKANRPDLQLAKSEVTYSTRLYQYEKSKSVPDLYLKGNYDRNGNTMLNFVGFGLAVDLPFFSRNQGNIRAAALSKQQAALQAQNTDRLIENELMEAYVNYLTALDFKKQMDSEYVRTLNEVLEAYTRNFRQQHISVLEYIDFLEAYLNNRKSILEAAKSVWDTAEALNYAAGADIIQP